MSNQKSTSREHEARHKKSLQALLKLPENRECADCTAKGVNLWASVNLGVFDCIKCAGIHRNLGVHISKVRSVTLDKWTDDQVETMERIGNARAKEIYEAGGAPPKPREDEDASVIERYIRNKYEKKMWMAKDSEQQLQRREANHSRTTSSSSDSDEPRRNRERTDRDDDSSYSSRSKPVRNTPSPAPKRAQPEAKPQQTQAPLFSFDDDFTSAPANNFTTKTFNTAPVTTTTTTTTTTAVRTATVTTPSSSTVQASDFFNNNKKDDILAMFDTPVQPAIHNNNNTNINTGFGGPMNNRAPMMNNAPMAYPPMNNNNNMMMNRGGSPMMGGVGMNNNVPMMRPPAPTSAYGGAPMMYNGMGGGATNPMMGGGMMNNNSPMMNRGPMMNNNGPMMSSGHQPPMMMGGGNPMMGGGMMNNNGQPPMMMGMNRGPNNMQPYGNNPRPF